jgi:outer membrane biosynthesis protein TonB
MKERKRKTLAMFTTIAFHALAVVVLLLLGLSYPEPPPSEIGVEMDYGSLTDVGNAMAGEVGGSDAENVATIPQTDDNNYVTQNTESSPITAKPKKPQQTTPKPVPNTESEQTIDPNALYNKGNVKTGSGSGQGTGSGSGTGAGNNGGGGSGMDLAGSGTSFSLSGRNAKSLIRPATSTSEGGTIVIEIIVDREGNVLRAKAIAKGTTITNATLYHQCEIAAKSSKFSPKADAAEEQRGTITYIFTR